MLYPKPPKNYQATQQGSYVVPPFNMIINGKEYASQGTTIVVGEPIKGNPEEDAIRLMIFSIEEITDRKSL